jgi:phage anti-repressor protein
VQFCNPLDGAIDYALTIDASKEIAMLNEGIRQEAKQYFIMLKKSDV